MSKVLENLKYAKSHEWVRLEGEIAFIGISDYAQHSLGSIVYIDAGEVGNTVSQFEEFGAVESVKAASDMLSPVSGEVIEINENVTDNPELLNEDPYHNWIIKVQISDISEIGKLLDSVAYQQLVK